MIQSHDGDSEKELASMCKSKIHPVSSSCFDDNDSQDVITVNCVTC